MTMYMYNLHQSKNFDNVYPTFLDISLKSHQKKGQINLLALSFSFYG